MQYGTGKYRKGDTSRRQRCCQKYRCAPLWGTREKENHAPYIVARDFFPTAPPWAMTLWWRYIRKGRFLCRRIPYRRRILSPFPCTFKLTPSSSLKLLVYAIYTTMPVSVVLYIVYLYSRTNTAYSGITRHPLAPGGVSFGAGLTFVEERIK